jgi:nitroimidazol reductase NimA-like FMN-containing flavoprotein (pyridoxamine 5'-phosphate oxidase superfamily)
MAGRDRDVCITVTLLDGFVLAKSAFHHSVNYRSVAVFGSAGLVTDDAEKLRVRERLIEHVHSGRWAQCRTPNDKELLATAVLRVPLVEVSAKVREGGPIDDEEDLSLPYWAGVVPVTVARGTTVAHQ